MADAMPQSSSWLDSATKFAAVAGAFLAVGQGFSTWVDGHYKAGIEQERTKREIQLARIKDEAALAESYLKIILAKDTPQDGRAILYSALGQLDGHPLQKWAEGRYQAYVVYAREIDEAYKRREEAAQFQVNASANIKEIQARIDELNAELRASLENPEKSKELHELLVAAWRELGKAKSDLTIAQVTVQVTTAKIDQSQQADPSAPVLAANEASALSLFGGKVNADLLKAIFPASAAKNIDGNWQYLQSALAEFQISDPRLIATIIADFAVDAPGFQSGEEPLEWAKRYEGRADLGNTEQGDGIKYRGRGYILLTGRDNYAKMSQRLGLGTRLVDSPDDAKSPEVAARIGVAYFADRKDLFLAALDAGDLTKVRRLINGGSNQLSQFIAAYQSSMAQLVGIADPTGFRIFVHLGQVSGRAVPTNDTINSTLRSLGLKAPTSDQQFDKFGPGVDYFHEDDRDAAEKIGRALGALLGTGDNAIPARKQSVSNPKGTFGIWF